MAPHKRRFGMMFQEFALFPHKTVLDNVAFGLEMQKKDAVQIRQRCLEMLELVGLADMARRSVDALSGGERQRVALARSLAPEPVLLMLDEPMGALDRLLRERLMHDLRQILKAVQVTAIFVTHDHGEAFGVADQVAVMHNGRIAQKAPPEVLYRHPAGRFVARFLGFRNFLPGRVCGDGSVETDLGRFKLATPLAPADARVTLLIRPEAALPVSAADAACPAVCGTLNLKLFRGLTYRIGIKTDPGANLYFDLTADRQLPEVGRAITLSIDPAAVVALPSSDSSSDT